MQSTKPTLCSQLDTLLKKMSLTSIWGNEIDIDGFYASSGLKMTGYVPVSIPQRKPSLPWPAFHSNAKWDRRSPKRQLRWSFPLICLRTVASSNKQLHIFSQLLPPIEFFHCNILTLVCGQCNILMNYTPGTD